MQRVQQNDHDAFKVLYIRHYEPLMRYIYSVCKDQNIAEDIVQETMAGLWSKREKINIQTSIKSYLFNTGRNRYVDLHRKNQVRSKYLEHIQMHVAISTLTDTSESEEYEKRMSEVMQHIKALPPKRKAIFVLSKLQRYKYKEIAELMGISERTVEQQVRQAMLHLKNAFLTMLIWVWMF